MSKRREALKNYLTPITSTEFSAENQIARPRPQATSGALQSMNDAISGLSREAEDLRQMLAAGAAIVEIDPDIIDSSFVRDRLDDFAGEEFDSLVNSIAENGQAIPVLVRPNPDRPERYQLAFGHRRVAALRVLDRPVKAFVRQMSDEELVIAQGSENLERKDLSFIERAIFAFGLEEKGMSRAVIMSVFGTSSKGVLSEMISLARRLPGELVRAVGPAPRIGRPRWIALADLLANGNKDLWQEVIRQPRFTSLGSNERFNAVYRALSAKGDRLEKAPKEWTPDDKRVSVRQTATDKILTMSFSAKDGRLFGEWISGNLEELYRSFRQEANQKQE